MYRGWPQSIPTCPTHFVHAILDQIDRRDRPAADRPDRSRCCRCSSPTDSTTTPLHRLATLAGPSPRHPMEEVFAPVDDTVSSVLSIPSVTPGARRWLPCPLPAVQSTTYTRLLVSDLSIPSHPAASSHHYHATCPPYRVPRPSGSWSRTWSRSAPTRWSSGCMPSCRRPRPM